MNTKVEEPPPELELEWIKLSNELGAKINPETLKEKILRKSKENPLVPIGCLATLSALSYGLWCFRKGRAKMSQKMMRWRVGAQGFTIIAFVVGLGLTANKSAQK